MITISHWGQFNPAERATADAPPIGMIAEVYRLRKALDDNIASTKKFVLSGTYLRMIS